MNQDADALGSKLQVTQLLDDADLSRPLQPSAILDELSKPPTCHFFVQIQLIQSSRRTSALSFRSSQRSSATPLRAKLLATAAAQSFLSFNGDGKTEQLVFYLSRHQRPEHAI